MPAVDQFGQPVARDRAYRFGRLISQIFHPIINGFASFLLIGAASPDLPSARYGLGWAAACVMTLIIPPTCYFYFRLFRGDFSDDDISRRSERNGLYVTALASTIAGSGVLSLLGVPGVFLRFMAAAVGVTAVCMVINFRWKISVHSASIATLSTLATLMVQSLAVVLWMCALVVGWARIRTGNHTPLQVVAGWSVAVVGVILAFQLGR
ncbi:MAG TPA: phosphatase PAP2 family protein [Herpetosiphonaceae bacterium]|nr:phosphatase PAP2 family protein [Herpetosiphonaceae bacterium]